MRTGALYVSVRDHSGQIVASAVIDGSARLTELVPDTWPTVLRRLVREVRAQRARPEAALLALANEGPLTPILTSRFGPKARTPYRRPTWTEILDRHRHRTTCRKGLHPWAPNNVIVMQKQGRDTFVCEICYRAYVATQSKRQVQRKKQAHLRLAS